MSGKQYGDTTADRETSISVQRRQHQQQRQQQEEQREPYRRVGMPLPEKEQQTKRSSAPKDVPLSQYGSDK